MSLDAGKAVSSTVDALKAQPLALALIVINVLFLVAAGLFVTYIGRAVSAERVEHRAALRQLMDSCLPTPKE